MLKIHLDFRSCIALFPLCDNLFCAELSYFGHFCGTNFVWGGSQLDILLELEDWITAGQVSVEEQDNRR